MLRPNCRHGVVNQTESAGFIVVLTSTQTSSAHTHTHSQTQEEQQAAFGGGGGRQVVSLASRLSQQALNEIKDRCG